MRGAVHITAQLVGHGQQHGKERKAHDHGHPQHTRRHQPSLRGRKDDEESQRSTHNRCAPTRFPVTGAPQPEGGIHHISQLHQRRQLPEPHPRIHGPQAKHGHRLTEEMDLLQALDGTDMQVESGAEVRHHRQQPQTERCPEEPPFPGAKIEMNKPQAAHGDKPVGKMSPPNRRSICCRRLRIHGSKLARRHPNHADRQDKETQKVMVGPLVCWNS